MIYPASAEAIFAMFGTVKFYDVLGAKKGLKGHKAGLHCPEA